MKKGLQATVLCSIFMLCMVSMPLNAGSFWSKLKIFIQKDVQIIQESDDMLVIYHHALEDTLVLTRRLTGDSDIYSALEKRRGGNPYRIWIASEQFWNNPDLPRQQWGKFFRSQYLRVLRPPRTSDKSNESLANGNKNP